MFQNITYLILIIYCLKLKKQNTSHQYQGRIFVSITLVSEQDICQYQSRIFVSITLVSEQDIRVGYLSVSHQYQSRIFVSITLVSEQDIRVGYLPVSHWYKVSIEQVLSEVYFRYKFQMLLMLEQNSMQQWSTINKLLCFIYHI